MPWHFWCALCLKAYMACLLYTSYSGWKAYCADCGEAITHSLLYMSKEAAASITQMQMGLTYYYLCPFCANLEQGVLLDQHMCKSISWNMYHVVYASNASGIVGGYMEKSIHMYNNEAVYEGETITPAVRLNKNTYTRIGYEFDGWNTEPDGSGAEDVYKRQTQYWSYVIQVMWPICIWATG